MLAGPHARQVFFGDDWPELRDAQAAGRADLAARLAGRVRDMYLRAAVVAGRETDPVAIALRNDQDCDLRAVYGAHDHLAGHWRLIRGHLLPPPGEPCDLAPLLRDWQDWAMSEAGLWIVDQPLLVRRFALAFVFSRTSDSLCHAIDLWDALKEHYPLTPPAQGDFFDDPASYTPYRQGPSAGRRFRP